MNGHRLRAIGKCERARHRSSAGPILSSAVAAPLSEICVLGPLAVRCNGQVVELASAKQRALLAALVARRNESLSVETLIDVLWGEQAPASARHALRVHMAELRRRLGPCADAWIATRPGGYACVAPATAVDADRFERLAARGRTELSAGNTLGARRTLAAAVGEWRGPAFPDLADHDGARACVVRLEEMRRLAIEDLGEVELLLGRHFEAVGALEAAVVDEPLRERRWEQLVVALYRCGRQADALRAHRRVRDLLVEELGIEPGARLRALERAVLAQDAAAIDGWDRARPREYVN